MTGLQPGEGLPMWKSDTSDGPETHQNSNVPKSVAGLNGKQKFSTIHQRSRVEFPFVFSISFPFVIFLLPPFHILFVLSFACTWKMRRSFPDYRRTSQFDSVESAVGDERNHSSGRETAGCFLQRQGSSPVRPWGLQVARL